jgi:DNA-binding beta-propeller fold protein YncE
MKSIITSLVCVCCLTACKGQAEFGAELLKLEKLIEMPGVRGRVDHMEINLKKQVLYVAALGNNSVEVIDVQKGATIHSIKGLDEPQGVVYIPERDEIVIANGGNGNCVFYNAESYAVITSLHLAGDADNVRYNAADGKIYVGYGNGGIAVIDARSHKLTGDVKLPAHPESFQLDQKNNLLYVNLPDANSIAVINLNEMKIIHTWKTNGLSANFPMALDNANHRVIVGYRHPAVLVSYDANSGKQVSRNDMVSDVDDVFYDASKQLVYTSGGGGAINIFKNDAGNTYKRVAQIPTRSGARTSFLIPALHRYILAERATGGKEAAIEVYKINGGLDNF